MKKFKVKILKLKSELNHVASGAAFRYRQFMDRFLSALMSGLFILYMSVIFILMAVTFISTAWAFIRFYDLTFVGIVVCYILATSSGVFFYIRILPFLNRV